jgi:hypothetical protein
MHVWLMSELHTYLHQLDTLEAKHMDVVEHLVTVIASKYEHVIIYNGGCVVVPPTRARARQHWPHPALSHRVEQVQIVQLLLRIVPDTRERERE